MPPDSTGKGFQLGFSEQYSSLSDLYLDGTKVPNALNQYMDSSNSQVLVNYRFNPKYSLQLNMPLIHRSFQRVEGDALQTGSVAGIGDMLLVGTYVPFQRKNPSSQFRWKMIGGLKFPTGSADRISEELTEMDSSSSESVPSAVHGHDLALGSGSWDGLIGAEVSGGAGRWYYLAHLQYAIRTRGSFDYKYANDLLWYGGPGYYLAAGHNYTFGLQGQFGGEQKGADELGSQKTDDTA
ncbi:MAG TPA: hypothetical protein VLR94_06230, partial [Acidobacteriota bacterium]|nr:hypothetical protein [Acidobacteriota bacterium]